MTSAHRKRKARSERRSHLLRNAGSHGCREAPLSGQCLEAHGRNDQRTAGSRKKKNFEREFSLRQQFIRKKTDLATSGSMTAEKKRAHYAHDSHGSAFERKPARGRIRRVKGKLKSRTLVSYLFL